MSYVDVFALVFSFSLLNLYVVLKLTLVAFQAWNQSLIT